MSKSKQTKSIVVFVIAFVAIAFAFVVIILGDVVGSSSNSSIQIIDSGLQYNYMHVTVVFDDDRTCHVKNELEGEFLENPSYNSPNHGLYVDIPVNSGERIKNLSVDATAYYNSSGERSPYVTEFESMFRIVRVRVGDGDKSFRMGNRLAVTVEYDYTFPKHKYGNDVLAIAGIGNGWTSNIIDASVSVTYPAAPEQADGDYGIYVGGALIAENDENYDITWSNDGKTVTVKSKNDIGLRAYNGIELAYKMPDGTIGTPSIGLPMIIVIVIGAVILLVAVLMKALVMKSKHLTPVVDFYPPRIEGEHGKIMPMLPVQMGKIIDDSCSKEDVTSLIFYWASKGYLQIDERESDTYFIKLKNVSAVRDYERKMFNKIFANAEENEDGKKEVSLSSLSGKFADTVSSTKSAVDSEYKGKFYTSSSKVSYLMMVLCILFAAGVGVLSTFTISFGMFNLFALGMVVPVIASFLFGTYIAKYFYKFTEKKRVLLFIAHVLMSVFLSFALSMLIPTCVMGWAARIPFCLTVAGISGVAPFLIKRTDEYTEQLNAILGFRNFLRDAEKEKLEMLLAEDPQYYYAILPYANVLGVSEIWSKKFADLTIEQPTYIRSYRHYVFYDYLLFRSMSQSVGRGLTYVEPKVSSGSFSSGGGHSSGGGGGFSGGSFGGGGGGRW